MVIIYQEIATFKNDVDNIVTLIAILIIYNLHTFNNNLPYCQCIDW